MRKLLLVFLATAAPAFAQDTHGPHTHRTAQLQSLGDVAFNNSGNATAQKPFLTGLALLHSFEYDRAAQSFRDAVKADPNFALAYWMDAFTSSKVVWGLDDPAAARATLARLAPTAQARLALARTPSEGAFGRSVEAFYADGDLRSRIAAFSKSMRSWASTAPTDHEARAFAALAIIWEAFQLRGAAADSLNREAVAHAQYVFDKNPRHPGAAHYIIHASDNPAGAERGLHAAREYSRIAPDAEHALHMPSHIFLPLGLWEDMVQSNERSWKASRSAITDPASAWQSDWHGLNWLQYAYLQLGRWKDARALIDTARALTPSMQGRVSSKEFPDGAYIVEQLAFRYGSETGDWSHFPIDTVAINANDSSISDRAKFMASASLYQRATVAALRGDSVAAKAGANALPASRRSMATMVGITLLEKAGDSSAVIAALETLRPGARVDRYSSMAPSPLRNIDETLGAALVAAGRPEDAIAIYREALRDRPRRAASLMGLARAQSAAGDSAGARQTREELTKMWHRADAEARSRIGAR